jgi:hypothetical protein
VNKKISFWELLEHYRIEIPIIQRDYAQGRTENKNVVQIRKTFIRALFDMLTVTPKDLDFIYGSVLDNNLILLDGQQRITTLFLLHWYLARATGIINNNGVAEKLGKFSYKTRASSREFCTALTKPTHDLSFETEKKLSEVIADAPWFFSNWRNDPTVKGMLEVLSEIHTVFRKEKDSYVIIWEKLISKEKPPVTFHFLNMDEFNLTDELYIKMNARGRSLSDFENFKAWLQDYTSKLNIPICSDFWEKLDRDWTDIIWKLKKTGENEIDAPFLCFFKSIAMSHFANNVRLDSKLSPEEDQIITSLRDSEYVSLLDYNNIKCFDEVSLFRISTFLNWYGQYGRLLDSNQLPVKSLFSNILGKPIYIQHLRFHALILFMDVLTTSGKGWCPENEKQLIRWLRVCLNLINNRAYDNSADYAKAVQALTMLANGAADVYTNLRNINESDIMFFTEIQVREEILKAKLILENEEWETSFTLYEKHEYFYGQIGFLLELSKDAAALNIYNKEIFEKYSKIAEDVFTSKNLDDDQFIIQRALLTLDNYLPYVGHNRSFCSSARANARDRNENWRKVFNDVTRRAILKNLFDRIDNGEKIDQIVKNPKTGDWRDYFIDCPETICYCGEKLIRFNSSEEIYLLGKYRMSGWHAELRSYYLYIKELKPREGEIQPFTRLGYHSPSGHPSTPCAFIDGWHFKGVECVNLALDISFNGQNYILDLFCREGKDIPNVISGKLLGNNNFSWCQVQGRENQLQKIVSKEELMTILFYQLIPNLKQLAENAGVP